MLSIKFLKKVRNYGINHAIDQVLRKSKKLRYRPDNQSSFNEKKRKKLCYQPINY